MNTYNDALIDRLADENERLRKALEQYADAENWLSSTGDYDDAFDLWHGEGDEGYDLARAALAGVHNQS